MMGHGCSRRAQGHTGLWRRCYRLWSAPGRPLGCWPLLLIPAIPPCFAFLTRSTSNCPPTRPSAKGVLPWLNAIQLDGFPQQLVRLLKENSGNDLSLIATRLTRNSPLVIHAHRGKYRLTASSSMIGAGPRLFDRGISCTKVTDLTTGRITRCLHGAAVLDISGPRRYPLSFEPQ